MTSDLLTPAQERAYDDAPRDTVAWSIFDTEDDCPAEVPGEPDDGPRCVHGPVGFDWLHIYDDEAGNRWWTNRYVILRQDVLDQDEHLTDLTELVTESDNGAKPRQAPIAVVTRLDPGSASPLLAALAGAVPDHKSTGPAESHFYISSLAPLLAAGLEVDARPLIKTQPDSAAPFAHVIRRGDDPVGLIMPIRDPASPYHVTEVRPAVRAAYARLRAHSHLPATLAWRYAAIAATTVEPGDTDG